MDCFGSDQHHFGRYPAEGIHKFVHAFGIGEFCEIATPVIKVKDSFRGSMVEIFEVPWPGGVPVVLRTDKVRSDHSNRELDKGNCDEYCRVPSIPKISGRHTSILQHETNHNRCNNSDMLPSAHQSTLLSLAANRKFPMLCTPMSICLPLM